MNTTPLTGLCLCSRLSRDAPAIDLPCELRPARPDRFLTRNLHGLNSPALASVSTRRHNA